MIMNSPWPTYVLGIVAALLVLLITGEMLRRRSLRERHAVWWFAGGLIALVCAIFPPLIEGLARTLGVAVPTNLIFFFSTALLFFVCLQASRELTRLEARSQSAGESIALLETRVRRLEGALGVESPTGTSSPVEGTNTNPIAVQAPPASR